MQKGYRLQPIVQLANICAARGIERAVLSPGSRCAPLTISFVRHPQLHTYTISDERSAAFVALGMAQRTRKPVVLVCTSGTAVLNYGPAVAEAFYQQVPLLLLTADRPAEWVDQQDGQTIRQERVFANHAKASYSLPADYEHADVRWFMERTLQEAISLSQEYPQGPVHVNIPLREPFYPEAGEALDFSAPVRPYTEFAPSGDIAPEHWAQLAQTLRQSRRILLLPAQEQPSEQLSALLAGLPLPVVADIISNQAHLPNAIRHQDVFLGKIEAQEEEALRPDLLITYGKSLISKNLKQFLRKYRPAQHWHVQPAGQVADTFQCLTHVVRMTPERFLQRLAATPLGADPAYVQAWKALDGRVAGRLPAFFAAQPLSDLQAVYTLLGQLPAGSDLHLSNSMSVRYANFLNMARPDVGVYANRGTSGIDGSSSTAVGHSLLTDRTQVLLTGDLAFFYDRNAFWNKYVGGNLKVLLLNNHGGVIFRMIEGPARQPELEEYFETTQALEASHLAQEYGFAYFRAEDTQQLQAQMPAFLAESNRICIFEVLTDKVIDKQVVGALKALALSNEK